MHNEGEVEKMSKEQSLSNSDPTKIDSIQKSLTTSEEKKSPQRTPEQDQKFERIV